MTVSSISFALNTNSPAFDVVEMEGKERLSAMFRFSLTVVGAPGAAVVAGSSMIGKTATITIRSQRAGEAEVVVPYYGLVTRFSQAQQVGSDGSARIYYQLVFEPRIVRLRETRTSAVYVDNTSDADAEPPVLPTQTVVTIVTSVLDRYAAQIPDLFEFRQVDSSKLRARDYVCQYEESDLDFCCRLLESEGLFFFFEHDETKRSEKLVISGSREVHPLPATAKRSSLRVGASSGLVDDDLLESMVCRQEMLPSKVVLRNYNDQTASRGVISAEAPVHSQGVGEVTIFGEDFRTDTEGSALAEARAQEVACRGIEYLASGAATGLRSGYLVTLAAHPYNAALVSRRYLPVSIDHTARCPRPGQATTSGGSSNAITYRVTLRALPFDETIDDRPLQFRPPRTTNVPRIFGTISAFVDDDSSNGQYASLDKQGRYKVILPFADYSRTFRKTDGSPQDSWPGTLRGKGSARIRMATPYSGMWTQPGGAQGGTGTAQPFGMHFPLHKGSEVLLSFIEGDPNRPVIVAAVPNSTNTNVVRGIDQPLPSVAGATSRTEPDAWTSRLQSAGGNRIELFDGQDRERLVASTPYQETYLRLGSAFEGDPHDRNGEFSYYLRSGTVTPPATPGGEPTLTGKGKAVFPAGFTQITGGLLDSDGNELEFGKLAWEKAYGWDADTGANITNPVERRKYAAADTELNITFNITHTNSDNIERTLGNSLSTTIGNTTEYTLGDCISETIGNSKEYVTGGSVSYVGLSVSRPTLPTLATNRVADASSPTVTLPSLIETARRMRPAVKPGDCSDFIWSLGGFGFSQKEQDKSAYKLPSSITWGEERLRMAALELNLQDTWSHTLGDSIERTFGDHYSESYGKSTEIVYGDSSSTIGTSSERVKMTETVWGDSTSEVHGDSNERVTGDTHSITMGRTNELMLGGTSGMHIGGAAELFLGGTTSIDLLLALELMAAFKISNKLGEFTLKQLSVKEHNIEVKRTGPEITIGQTKIKLPTIEITT